MSYTGSTIALGAIRQGSIPCIPTKREKCEPRKNRGSKKIDGETSINVALVNIEINESTPQALRATATEARSTWLVSVRKIPDSSSC